MRFHTNLFMIAVLAGLAFAGLSQAAAVEGAAPDEIETPPFPYDAVITGDDVYIRSGPGTNFYHCGKFNKGDRVRVVAKQFSWSRIVPPAGSFSWISMQYVKIDPSNPGVGTVTGDNVRVYAGSDYVKPLYSTTLQDKLSTGDKVKLLGEQMDEYYKIAPPPAAYLWVSTNFTKPAPVPVEPPAARAVAPSPGTPEPNEAVAVTPSMVTPQSALEKYRALKQQVEAERAKPADQQDYSEFKKGLTELATDENADKAARYAEFVLRQIEGYELALTVAEEIRLQNEQLQKVKAGIEKARKTRLAEIQDLGRFAVTGEFQTYATLGPGNYRIVDDSGSMVCYALPAGAVAQMDLSGLVGRKVGLIGEIEPHKPTAGALVRFTNVVELE